MGHVPDRIVKMALWTLDDDGNVDREMLDIILAKEKVVLLPSHRADLHALLHHWHRRFVMTLAV